MPDPNAVRGVVESESLVRLTSVPASGWPRIRLAEIIASLDAGVSVNGTDRPAGPKEHGVLKVSAVTEGRFKPGENKAVLPAELSRVGISPRHGDILISRANTTELVGASALVDRDYPFLHLPDKLWRVVLADETRDDRPWLSYLLASEVVRKELRARATGSSGSMKNVAQAAFLAIEVPRPPVEQQRRLGAVFQLFDQAVGHLTRLTAAKREFKRRLTQELLTGQRRFPEFGSTTRWNATPAGRLPHDWAAVPLRDITVPVTRRNEVGEDRVLTCSGAQGLINQTEYFTKAVASELTSNYYLLRRGEFAYNRSSMRGYPFGATKRLDRYEQGALSTLNICFALSNSSWDSDFAVQYFESGLLNQQLGRVTRVGARAHGLLNVTKSDFFDLYVPVPSRAQQRRIANVLSGLDKEISLLEAQCNRFAVQKRALMEKLLNGGLDIIGDAPRD